jgi:DNA-binding XRE family transcriptional regulator
MGEELGVTAEAISHWENGRYGPSLENAARYARLLDELTRASS